MSSEELCDPGTRRDGMVGLQPDLADGVGLPIGVLRDLVRVTT